MSKIKDLLKCSFCSKSQKAVKKLVAGPGVYICDECIALCNTILAEQDIEPKESTVPVHTRGLEEMSTDDLITNLSGAAAVTQSIDRHLKDTVNILRARGFTWAKIGETFGISRQAAWERFADDE
jgi:hypothetical protein